MPTVVFTQNSAVQWAGGSVDTIYTGLSDLTIKEENPAGNFNVDSQGAVGNGAGLHNNMLFAFRDLKHLPVAPTVSSAILRVYVTSTGFGSQTVTPVRMAVDWGLTEASWNNRNTFDGAWGTAGARGAGDSGDAGTPVEITTAAQYYEWDVTAIVSAILAGSNIFDTNFGIGLLSNYGADTGLRFCERYNGVDGQRVELVVQYTGGTSRAAITQNSAITFTGANGDPVPAPLTEIAGTVEIQGNRMRAYGTIPDPGVAVGWLVGAETNAPDGVVSGYINANGSVGEATGLMIRHIDPHHFIDCVDVEGTLSLVRIINNATAAATNYAIPGYDANQSYHVEITMEGDRIQVRLDSVLVIDVVESLYHNATIHGAKLAGTTATIDDLVLPNLDLSPPINMTNVRAGGVVGGANFASSSTYAAFGPSMTISGSWPTSYVRGASASLAVATPATVPTTENTTITLGGESLSVTAVSGAGPYTIDYTVPASIALQHDEVTGYEAQVVVAGEILTDATLRPLEPATGWQYVATDHTQAVVDLPASVYYVEVVGDRPAALAALNGGQYNFPEQTDQGIAIEQISVEGYVTLATAPEVNQTFDGYLIEADGTVNPVYTFTIVVVGGPVVEITGSATPSIAENTTAVGTYTITNRNGEAPTLSGVDAAQFSISPVSGDDYALAFLSAPDFDSPADAGSNNVYNVTIELDNLLGSSDSLAVAVTVTNVLEESITPPDDITIFIPEASSGLAHADGTLTAWLATASATGGAVSNNLASLADPIPDGVYVLTFTSADAPNETAQLTVALDLAPTVSGGTAFNVAENSGFFTTLTIANRNGEAPTLSGADSGLFSITALGGDSFRLSMTAKDFETPIDADTNNVYVVTVNIDDGVNPAVTHNVAVTVTDVDPEAVAPQGFVEFPRFPDTAALPLNLQVGAVLVLPVVLD